MAPRMRAGHLADRPEATRQLESGPSVFERNDYEARKGWARARIETLTADIKKLGVKPMTPKERKGMGGKSWPAGCNVLPEHDYLVASPHGGTPMAQHPPSALIEILQFHRLRLKTILAEYHLQMELLEEELGTERFHQARQNVTFGLGQGSNVDQRIEKEVEELTEQIDALEGDTD